MPERSMLPTERVERAVLVMESENAITSMETRH
jgi:hypothetical protein